MSMEFGPLLEVARIQSEINRLFDNLLDLDAGTNEGGTWLPISDVIETEEALVVKVELPGVGLENLTLSALGGDVILRGEKRRVAENGPAKFHLAERAFGRFRRVIHLTVPVNTHKAEAMLSDGYLRIRFPKVPNRRGEEVPIEVETP